jgi:DNA-binding transcriptional LysR family regulator
VEQAIKIMAAALSVMVTALTDMLVRLERIERNMADQKQQLQDVLGRIATSTTKLGEDIQRVIQALKDKVPPGIDISAELNTADAIAQALINTDEQVLQEENPIPVPNP